MLLFVCCGVAIDLLLLRVDLTVFVLFLGGGMSFCVRVVVVCVLLLCVLVCLFGCCVGLFVYLFVG